MIFHVGGLFDPQQTHWQDGMEYSFAANQHWIKLVWSRLTVQEVAAIDHGPLQFALYAEEEQLILFLRLGSASHWQEMPFTLWRVPEEDRTLPEIAPSGEHASMMMFLIQAETGRIAALRYLTIAAEMTTALYAGMHRQMQQPFDAQAYDLRLSELRQRYATPDAFVADTQAVRYRCNGGD